MKYYNIYSEIATMDFPRNKKRMCYMTSAFADSIKDAKHAVRTQIENHGYFVLRIGVQGTKTAIKICEDNKKQPIASFVPWEEIDKYFANA